MTAAPAGDDLALLRAYEPVVRLTEGELFYPTAVEEYVACCELLERGPGDTTEVVVGKGDVTLDRLAEVGAARAGGRLFLRFVDQPLSRPRVARWRRRTDRPRFGNAGRLARVGVLSRIIDALMRMSLFVRGSVAYGAAAAAETQYRELMRRDHHPYYGRVIRSGGYVALQYWMFYAFNDWRSRVYGVNDHEADWEQVVVYLADHGDGSLAPAWVVFSAHDETGDDLRRRWDDPDLSLVGDHPVVFAGIGSHSGAYLAGEYLTTFEPPAFGGVVRWYRRAVRVVLPWTRGQGPGGVGIPYVDYARGDGRSIGPGEGSDWSPVLIDDDTPWVVDYRGLWGNDTDDPFGGERGPAGPRYERSGSVRQSWGDVIGWAGLSKVAPNEALAEELIRDRLREIDTEEASIGAGLDAERTRLRADLASGVVVTDDEERRLDDLAAERVRVHDEGRRLRRRLVDPPPPAGPHDHLRHRRMPVPLDTRSRRRILSIWSALSTPLILGVIALLFLPGRPASVFATIFAWLLLLLLIEALARRKLFRFLVTLVALAAMVIAVSVVVGLVFFYGWRVTVSVSLGLLALVLLLANLRELARD